jgi:hypothetical protein
MPASRFRLGIFYSNGSAFCGKNFTHFFYKISTTMKKYFIFLVFIFFVSCKDNTSSDNGKGEENNISIPESEVTVSNYNHVADEYHNSLQQDTPVEFRDSLLTRLNAIGKALKKKGVKVPDFY